MYKPKKVESKLLIYQKYTDVIDYGYNLLVKYPKTEKYALSSSIRNSMFETLRLILYANKIADKYIRIKILNKIDAEVAMQSFYVRFSYKQKYISSRNYLEWSKRLDEIGEIQIFLRENLKLELNAKTAYFKAKQGVNFCGFRIWKTHRLLREQSKKKMRRKLKNFEKLYRENRIELDYILACINSWMGHAKHCNSYNLVSKMFNKFVLRK